MRRVLLSGWVVLVLAGGAVTAPGAAGKQEGREGDRAAAAAIDACLRRLDPDFDVGYERIAARCPDLSRRLGESGWSAWLPRDWQQPGNNLSAGSLIELRVLVERELAARSIDRVPDVTHLRPVLAALDTGKHEREGWWDRFKAWLSEVFERRAPADDDNDLSRMVAAIGVSQTAVELVSYAAFGLVVVLALLIVTNELREAGVIARGKRSFVKSSGRLRRREFREELSGRDIEAIRWREIEQAALEQRPALLLEVIVARLAEHDRLLLSRGLTLRELMRAVRLLDEDNRERLARLAAVVESLRFSAEPVDGSAIADALEKGRELLDAFGARAVAGHS